MSCAVALVITGLILTAARRAWRGVPARPLIVVSAGARPAVIASDAVGIHAGMAPARASQRCPDAAVITCDAAALDATRAEIRDILSLWVPRVAWVRADVLVGLTSDAPDGAAGAVRGVLDACRSRGIAGTAGVAATPLVALIAARAATPGGMRVIAPGDEAGAIAPLPLTALPIDAALSRQLAAFGLTTIGAVAALPPGALQTQCGAAGARLARLLAGEWIWPGSTAAPPRLRWRRVFATPVDDGAVIDAALAQIATRAAQRLATRGSAAGQVSVQLTHDDGQSILHARWFTTPLTDASALRRQMLTLGRTTGGRAVAELCVVLDASHHPAVCQASLFPLASAERDRLRLPPPLQAHLWQAWPQDRAAARLERRSRIGPWEEGA